MPSVAFGAGVYAETLVSQTTYFAALFRATAAYATDGSTALPGGSVHFAWLAASLEACPLQFPLAPGWHAPVCIGGSYGALETRATLGDRMVRPAQMWWSAQARSGIAWRPPGSRWSAELLVGAQVPLYRARFYVEPDSTVFTTPRVAGFAGLGVNFWTL
jgi:hypothetical protein